MIPTPASTFLLLLLLLVGGVLDVTLEAAQAVGPQEFVVVEPRVHRAQRLGIQITNAGSAVFVSHHQASGAQNAKMLGDGRAAGAKVRGDLPDGVPTAEQEPEDLPTAGIGQGPENSVVLLVFMYNH